MPADSQTTIPCNCFSTCGPRAAAHFLSVRPAWVHDVASPWIGYLRAVYRQDDIPLPFELSRLSFFFHNSDAWRAEHTEVEWPMASCIERASAMTAQILHAGVNRDRPMRPAPVCSADVCVRWLRSGASATAGAGASTNESGLDAGEAAAGVTMFLVSGRDHLTRGAALFPRRLAADGYPSHPARQLHSGGTWVEVVRVDKGEEGGSTSWYGLWFYRVIGSGVYLNVNATWRLRSKDNQDDQGNRSGNR